MKQISPLPKSYYDLGGASFKAPAGGLYEVAAYCTIYNYVGREIVRNPKKKWWTFWRASYIWRDRYEKLETCIGAQIKYYEKGEELELCSKLLSS